MLSSHLMRRMRICVKFLHGNAFDECAISQFDAVMFVGVAHCGIGRWHDGRSLSASLWRGWRAVSPGGAFVLLEQFGDPRAIKPDGGLPGGIGSPGWQAEGWQRDGLARHATCGGSVVASRAGARCR